MSVQTIFKSLRYYYLEFHPSISYVSDPRTTCPVPGCSFTGSIASVAGHVSGTHDAEHDWNRLGYEGANHYKQKNGVYSSNDSIPACVGWLTDSHIGKKYGGYGNSQWNLQSTENLRHVVNLFKPFSLDTVVYTGDLFHNDGQGIEYTDVTAVQTILEDLPLTGLPIRYIRGNHAREDGAIRWEQFEKAGIAKPLSTNPYIVKNIAIYGIDYHSEIWWKKSTPALEPTDTDYKILCLHQSVEPFRSSNAAEIDLQTMVPAICRRLDKLPDLILLGHMHEIIDEVLTIEGQQVQVVSCGATTRIGRKKDSFLPGGGLIISTTKSIEYLRLE